MQSDELIFLVMYCYCIKCVIIGFVSNLTADTETQNLDITEVGADESFLVVDYELKG